MIVCEYFFKEFHTRGNSDYLTAWVAQVDQMGAEGWKVLDCCRKNDLPGFWTVILGRPECEFSENMKSNPRDGRSDTRSQPHNIV